MIRAVSRAFAQRSHSAWAHGFLGPGGGGAGGATPGPGFVGVTPTHAQVGSQRTTAQHMPGDLSPGALVAGSKFLHRPAPALSPCLRVRERESVSQSLGGLAQKGSVHKSDSVKSLNDGSKSLTVIHFNDVYNIEPREQEPCGGAARFVHKVQEMKDEQPLILFSGDAFNPSLMSAITKGEQMVPVLNNIGVHAAAVGNHDLDFGVEHMETLVSQCNFPWLMANVLDNEDKEPLGGSITHCMLDHNGIKVGLVGLVEAEWLATLATLSMDMVTYIDFVAEGKRLAAELRNQGAEVVIALTHMRMPNDERLSLECPEIDLILGGHDHHYEVVEGSKGKPFVFNSGTDFRDLSVIKLRLPPGRDALTKPDLSYDHVEITKDVPEHSSTAAVVKKYGKMVGSEMDKVIGSTMTELEGRFSVIRTGESNIGNFICDVWREATHADVVILNSGTIRSDTLHPTGDLKFRDLFAILPMMDETVLVEITGEGIIGALENGVSMYPKLEGRFPQVSGVAFQFDSSKEPGNRVVRDSVTVAGKPIDPAGKYKLATKDYLFQGKDGYEMISEAKVLTSSEEGPYLPTIVRNHFDHLGTLNANIKDGRLSIDDRRLSDDRMALPTGKPVTFHRSTSKLAAAALNTALEQAEDFATVEENEELAVAEMDNDVAHRPTSDGHAGPPHTTNKKAYHSHHGLVVKDYENARYCIGPAADGRITNIAA